MVDQVTGLRRARAAALLTLALPGVAYVYQGDELGLPEVLDLPAGARRDPTFRRTGGADIGRDGARVPIPWSGTAAPYGFGPEGSVPWLPQPAAWAALSVAAQDGDPSVRPVALSRGDRHPAPASGPGRRDVSLAGCAGRRAPLRARGRVPVRRQRRPRAVPAPGRRRRSCSAARGRRPAVRCRATPRPGTCDDAATAMITGPGSPMPRRAPERGPRGTAAGGRGSRVDGSPGIPIIPLGISPRATSMRSRRSRPATHPCGRPRPCTELR